jgi:type II secretory pathway pseudopilin PulG
MIGVLTILAVTAAFLVPNLVRQMQTASAAGEDAVLAEISQAIEDGIEATGLIPNPNVFPTNQDNPGLGTLQRGFGWAYLASNYTRLAGSNLLSVFPGYTETNTFRRMFLSTNLAAAALISDNDTGVANISTNITNWGGTLFPTSPKIFLVSASRPVIRFTTIGGTNAGNFGCDTNGNPILQVPGTDWNEGVVTNLEGWTKSFVRGVCEAPTNVVTAAWTNQGEFIHVRMIDLSKIFNKAKEAQERAIAQEDKNLDEIVRALVAAIQATGQLPNPNVASFAAGGWADLARSYTSLTDDAASSSGRGTLRYAFPEVANPNQTERRVYLDPILMQYALDGLNGGFATPADGWDSTVDSDGVLPVDMESGAMRMYIVSSSKSDLPLAAPVNSAGVQTAGGGYDNGGLLTALANWQKARTPPGDPMPGVIPVPNVIAQWGNPYAPLVNYSTRGEFVNVKVVDLRPLFCRVELIEYPLPQNAITTSPGIGYTAATAYNGISSAGFVFEFTTPAGSTTYPAGTAGTYKSGKGMIKRGGLIAVNDTGTIPIPGGASANFSASVSSIAPYRPWWEISPYTLAVDAQQMPIASNTQDFYVLKGTTLSLYADSNNRPASPILSVQINADCSFEYFNGSWTRVD